jgi:hypothetical protein
MNAPVAASSRFLKLIWTSLTIFRPLRGFAARTRRAVRDRNQLWVPCSGRQTSRLPSAFCMRFTANCKLPAAHCQLPAAHCLLPTAHCLLPAAYCLLPTACCLLPTACCLLPAAYCLLPAACCPLPAAYCLLPTACCPLLAACCPLPAACCLMPRLTGCRIPHHCQETSRSRDESWLLAQIDIGKEMLWP